MGKKIGTLGSIPTIMVSGRLHTDLTTLKTLFWASDTSAAPKYGTPIDTTTRAAYQITSAKTFTLTAIAGQAFGADMRLLIGYADSSVAFFSGSAPTAPVPFSGSTTIDTNILKNMSTAGVSALDLAPPNWVVPAATPGKYLYVENRSENVASAVYLYGYEA